MHQIQLLIAIALVLVEAGIFAYLSETWTVPLLASSVAVLAWSSSWRIPLQESQRFVGALALSVPFTLQWAFSPYEPDHIRVFILYSLAHAGGQYGLALQAAYLWVKQPREVWNAAYPLCGVCVLMAAADVQTSNWQAQVFQVVVLIFTLLTAAYYSLERLPLGAVENRGSTSRWVISALTLGMTFLIAVSCNWLLERSWATIERIYTQLMLQGNHDGGAGFSRNARLGSISERPSASDRLPMLRIYAVDEPGYLRGAAFDHYRSGSWLNETTRKPVEPVVQPPAGIRVQGEQVLFPLPGIGVLAESNAPQRHWRTVEVWPVPALSDAVFSPLEADWLSIAQTKLDLDPHGIAYPEGVQHDSSYCSYAWRAPHEVDGPAAGISPTARLAYSSQFDAAVLLSVPDNLDPKIRDLAREIFAQCETDEEKVYAASRWFRKNYHYELGVKIPPGQDPLTYFLLRRPPAHCEYFATGTAVLLRLAGVPCRYVTGFVSTEYNFFGGYWLARNKDAHAWVEAWLPSRGWVTVESTPAAGIPQASHSVQPSHLWDDLLLRVQMLRAQLGAGTWAGFLRALRTILSLFFTTPHGWLILAGICVWGMILWRRHVRFTVRRKLDPISAEFHQLLGELDRRLERWEFRRPDWETLVQFAKRLSQHPDPAVQSAAFWYRDYCQIRYRSDSIPAEIQRLKKTLPDVLERLQGRGETVG